MLDRRSVLATLLAGAGFFVTAPAFAGIKAEPFSEAAFEAAKKAGKPILLEISASWCPTCKVQKSILSELTSDPKFKNLVFLEIDFDSQKDVVRALRARSQSTLILFKGNDELGRSIGDTDPASIGTLLNKAV